MLFAVTDVCARTEDPDQYEQQSAAEQQGIGERVAALIASRTLHSSGTGSRRSFRKHLVRATDRSTAHVDIDGLIARDASEVGRH